MLFQLLAFLFFQIVPCLMYFQYLHLCLCLSLGLGLGLCVRACHWVCVCVCVCAFVCVCVCQKCVCWKWWWAEHTVGGWVDMRCVCVWLCEFVRNLSVCHVGLLSSYLVLAHGCEQTCDTRMTLTDHRAHKLSSEGNMLFACKHEINRACNFDPHLLTCHIMWYVRRDETSYQIRSYSQSFDGVILWHDHRCHVLSICKLRILWCVPAWGRHYNPLPTFPWSIIMLLLLQLVVLCLPLLSP